MRVGRRNLPHTSAFARTLSIVAKLTGFVNKTPYSWQEGRLAKRRRRSWCLSGIEMDAEQADFVGQGHRGTS